MRSQAGSCLLNLEPDSSIGSFPRIEGVGEAEIGPSLAAFKRCTLGELGRKSQTSPKTAREMLLTGVGVGEDAVTPPAHTHTLFSEFLLQVSFTKGILEKETVQDSS